MIKRHLTLEKPPTNPRSRTLLLAAFLAGAASLILEIAWTRKLQLFLGASVYTTAAILACVMLGMAAGNFFAGRWVEKSRNTNRLLMIFLACLVLYAVASPSLSSAIESANRAIFSGDTAWNHKHLWRAALALLFLAPPAFFIGALFPALVQLEAAGPDGAGRSVGRVYAAGTFGAAIGAWLTGFYLLASLGINGTIYIAAALCLLALVIMRTKSPAPLEPAPQPQTNPGKIAWLILAAMFLSGFTGLGYQIIWTRIMTCFFRDSIYDLSIVLTVFLAGIVLGSAAGVELLRFVKRPLALLAGVHVLLGLLSLTGLFLAHEFPYRLIDLQTNVQLADDYHAGYWTMGTLIKMGAVAAVMLVPASLLGMTYPLAMRIGSRGNSAAPRDAGLLSASNSLGAVLGALVTAFVLIGALQLSGAAIALATVNIATGCILLLAVPTMQWKTRIVSAASSLVLGAIIFVALPPWDVTRMSLAFLETKQNLDKLVHVQFHREDEFGTTSVIQIGEGGRYLITDRLYNQSTSHMNGLEDQRRLGHIPMFLHPAPKKVLVIGLGAGITLRGVADHNVESIDCVEISGSVIEAAKQFAAENASVLDDKRIHFIVDDGRAFVAATPKKYDVIVGDVYFPTSAGSGAMFTADYYRQCKDHLAPGGLMCQWLSASQLSRDELKTIFRSFQNAFPHATIWFGLIGENVPAIGMIAADAPLKVDDAAIRDRLTGSGGGRFQQLSLINLNTPQLMLSAMALTEIELRAFAADGPINTDDQPLTEFSAPKSTARPGRQGVENMAAIAKASGSGPSAILPPTAASAAYSEYADAKRIIIYSLAVPATDDPIADVRARLDGLAVGIRKYKENEELGHEYVYQASLLSTLEVDRRR